MRQSRAVGYVQHRLTLWASHCRAVTAQVRASRARRRGSSARASTLLRTESCFSLMQPSQESSGMIDARALAIRDRRARCRDAARESTAFRLVHHSHTVSAARSTWSLTNEHATSNPAASVAVCAVRRGSRNVSAWRCAEFASSSSAMRSWRRVSKTAMRMRHLRRANHEPDAAKCGSRTCAHSTMAPYLPRE